MSNADQPVEFTEDYVLYRGKVKTRKEWKRVKAPTPLRLKVDQGIIGDYTGSEIRTSSFGEYKIHLIKSGSFCFYASGIILNDTLALVPVGSRVKIVFKGYKESRTTDHKMKLYEVFIEKDIERDKEQQHPVK